jgi:phage terminase large subunit
MSPAASTIRRWRLNPIDQVRECFKAEPDAWQADVLAAFPKSPRMAMKACKGPGKSCVLAWLIWNFLTTRLHPKVVCTSITGDNLADGLWTELANWQNRSELLRATFTWTKTRIVANDHPETWWASARQWAKGADSKTQGETLAGIHADNVLFVLDEAGGIPDAVAAAAEAGLANVVDPTKQEAHLLIAGNPYALEGPLYRACTSERQLWHLTEISADPDDPKRTPRVSAEWARQQIEKFGRDNPWVLVNVFGKFPPSSLNALLGPDDVNQCLGRHLDDRATAGAARILGVDVARDGGDRTVLFPRCGPVAYAPVILRGANNVAVADRIKMAFANWKPNQIFIDATGGYGGGVVDLLEQAGLPVVGVQFAGKAGDPRYNNKRSEMWFLMAEWVKRGAALPPLAELVPELTCPTYFFHGDKFALEPKDQIKARLGFSPDLGDALCLTFAQPVAPPGELISVGVTQAVREYNPFG